MSNARLEDLRRELRQKFPGAHPQLGAAPVEDVPGKPLDPAVFPAGEVSEVVGSGAGWLVPHLLMASEGEKDPVLPEFVLIDGPDRFDPASFSAEECLRILWVRCGSVEAAVRAADLLVRDPNLSFVLLDTCGLPRPELRRVPASSWWRLKLSAEGAGCRLVVLSEQPQVPCARVRLDLDLKLELADFDRPRREVLGRLTARPERLRQAR